MLNQKKKIMAEVIAQTQTILLSDHWDKKVLEVLLTLIFWISLWNNQIHQ